MSNTARVNFNEKGRESVREFRTLCQARDERARLVGLDDRYDSFLTVEVLDRNGWTRVPNQVQAGV